MDRITESNGINYTIAGGFLSGLFDGKGRPSSLEVALSGTQERPGVLDYLRSRPEHDHYEPRLEGLRRNAELSARQLKRRGHREPVFQASLGNLSIDEASAIILYTDDGGPYKILNSLLRASNREEVKPFIEYLWLLMHGLSRCPRPTEPVVYRGIKGHVDTENSYVVDGEVVWSAFSSCTTKMSVLTGNAGFLGTTGARTVFHITLTTNRARRIYHLSIYFGESEVLLPPNTVLRVQDVADQGHGLIIIQLLEEACIDPILVFDDDIGNIFLMWSLTILMKRIQQSFLILSAAYVILE